MFDWIEDKLFCPFCGAINDDFQTKDLSCFLDRWTVKEIRKCVDWREKVSIYTRCKKCEEWIELIITGEANSPEA